MYTNPEGADVMLTEIPVEQFAAAIEMCAQETLAEVDLTCPPVDALRLAERLRLQLATDTTMDVRARFVRLPAAGQGTIFLAKDNRPERVQWAVAHEVGEFLAHRVVDWLGIDLADLPSAGRENVANRLAKSLLLPRHWFAKDGVSADWDLLELKTLYRTASHELIARRMLEMSPPIIVSLFDNGQLVWRKSNTLDSPPPLTTAERDAWQVAHTSNHASRCDHTTLPEGIRDIRCWPVHEPQWRREIVRCELPDW